METQRNRKCPRCGECMYFTGEFFATNPPKNAYACPNKHVKHFSESGVPDWGDRRVTQDYRSDLRNGRLYEYEDI